MTDRKTARPVRNMVTRSAGSLIILRHGVDVPSDAEWEECLVVLRRLIAERRAVKVLVITDVGAPTPTQRKALEGALNGQTVPIAVVSDSTRARFIAAVVALLNREIRSFSLNEIEEAFKHLRLTDAERDEAKRAIPQMNSQLG